MPSFRSLAQFAAALAAALTAGCQEQEQIQQYTVAKSELLNPDDGDSVTPPAGGTAQPEERHAARTLGAIVPQDGQTWYFKVMGPDEAVARQDEAFRQFLSSVKFAAGRPTWTLPEGWSEQASSGGVRFATIRIPAEGKPLELTVIPLPAQGDARESLVANVNRWRDQLALPPASADGIDEQVETIQLAEGTASYVNIAGQASTSDSMTGAPFASGGGGGGFTHPPIAPRTEPATGNAGSPAASDALPITFDVPTGWKPGRTGPFRLAAFEITDANGKAEVTVSKMTRQDLLANVDRWRGQVGLDPTTAEALENEAQVIEADGASGHLVNLAGANETILAAILNRGGDSWIFKLQGPTGLAAGEQDRFQSFVRSVKFK